MLHLLSSCMLCIRCLDVPTTHLVWTDALGDIHAVFTLCCLFVPLIFISVTFQTASAAFSFFVPPGPVHSPPKKNLTSPSESPASHPCPCWTTHIVWTDALRPGIYAVFKSCCHFIPLIYKHFSDISNSLCCLLFLRFFRPCPFPSQEEPYFS